MLRGHSQTGRRCCHNRASTPTPFPSWRRPWRSESRHWIHVIQVWPELRKISTTCKIS
ncbi:unnamed protein product [Ectocarpus sp. 6 AP-2014]